MNKLRFCMGLALLVFVGPLWAAPVAMVSSVKGSAQVKTGGRWVGARLRQKLSVGDQVKAGGGAAVGLVVLGNGVRYLVSPGQTATVRADSVVGAKNLGGGKGVSARVAQRLGGARTGAVMARAPKSPTRLTPQDQTWLEADNISFEWTEVPGASHYLFTLLDGAGNTVWSTRTAEVKATYPAAMPVLLQRTPYIWKMEPTLGSGKASDDWRWGIITILSPAEAAQLTTDAAEIQEQINNNPDPEDWTLLLLQTELFREYGVLGKTIELLEDLNLTGQPGVMEVLSEAYAEVGPYAQYLSPFFHLQSTLPDPEEKATPVLPAE